MSEILTAIYQDGAFVPEQTTLVQPGSRVRLVVESLSVPSPQATHSQTVDEFDDAADELSVRSGGRRLTRDQLHERNERD